MSGQLDLFKYSDEQKLTVHPASMKEIAKVVCQICDVDPEKIRRFKPGRVGNATDLRERQAKNIIAYIMYEIYKMKTTAISVEFGLRDHSTISYRIKQARKLLREDAEFRRLFIQCMKYFAREKATPQNAFHDIATYFLLHHHVSMPRPLIFELNRLDQWLRPFGYKLAIKDLARKKEKE